MKLDLNGFASSGSNKYDLSPKKSNIQYISRAIGRLGDMTTIQAFSLVFLFTVNWFNIFLIFLY